MGDPTYGLHVINTGAINANSYTTATGSSSAATGSSFIVAVGTNASSGVSISADTFSNSYSVLTLGSGANPVHETNDGSYLWLFLCKNGAGGANHTVTVSSSDTIGTVDFIEIQNASTTSPVDVSASAYSSSSPLSLPVTTSVAHEMVLGIGYSAAGQIRPITFGGAGFSVLDTYTDATWGMAVGYLTEASQGSQDPSYTRTGGVIAAITIAFSPGAGGSSAPIAWLT